MAQIIPGPIPQHRHDDFGYVENPEQVTMDFGHETKPDYPEPDIRAAIAGEVAALSEETSLKALSTRIQSTLETMCKYQAVLCNKTDSILGVRPETENALKTKGALMDEPCPSLYVLDSTVERLEQQLANLGSEVHRYAESGL